MDYRISSLRVYNKEFLNKVQLILIKKKQKSKLVEWH